MMNLQITNARLLDFDEIRYYVRFTLNGQQFNIDIHWREGKFDDVIAHSGFSGHDNEPNQCAYCGKIYTDCDICPEFYFNETKTQIIADQLAHILKEDLQKAPFTFNFDDTLIKSKRGEKVTKIIHLARENGHKIAGITQEFDRYIVDGTFQPPDPDDLDLLDDDDMYFEKLKFHAVSVKASTLYEEEGSKLDQLHNTELYSYVIPDDLLSKDNPFVRLQLEWKKDVIKKECFFIEHRERSTMNLLKTMLEEPLFQDKLYKFLDEYVTVDMLTNETEIHNAFVHFLNENRGT